MTPEHRLMNQIQLACGKRGYLVIRMNVFKGVLVDPKGNDRYINSGIPEGFPDMMVLKPNGEAVFVETKIHPRKPTEIQVKRQALLRQYGFKADTVYTLEEAMKLIDGE